MKPRLKKDVKMVDFPITPLPFHSSKLTYLIENWFWQKEILSFHPRKDYFAFVKQWKGNKYLTLLRTDFVSRVKSWINFAISKRRKNTKAYFNSYCKLNFSQPYYIYHRGPIV